jgi:N-acetylornithine carbamoyltransferase
MNVTVARPDGYDLDPEVYEWTKANCAETGTSFSVVNDPETGYDGAHVVYSRNWVTADAYQDGALQKKAEIEKAITIPGWTANAERMARTDNAIYSHPMPIDRGTEVTDEVASGPRSAIYDIAENRLHVQKAVMALTMGNL